MPAPRSIPGRVLYFVNVLGSTAPLCLDWTKVGVAISTVFTIITGVITTVQSCIGGVAHTEWALFASAVGLHGLSHGAAAVKRHQEN